MMIKSIFLKFIGYLFTLILAILVIYILLKKYYSDDSLTVLNEQVEIYDNDIVIGDFESQLSIIMYYSYYSASGKQFYETVFPILKKDYIDKGKVKLIIKLIEPSEHPDMLLALQTAICLNQYGKVDKFHNLLLFNPLVVHTEEFNQLIDDYINVNPELAECILNSNNFSDIIRNNNDFYKLNIKGTPTFVIHDKVLLGTKEGVNSLLNVINKELGINK